MLFEKVTTAHRALAWQNMRSSCVCLDLFLPDCVSQAGFLLDQAKRKIEITQDNESDKHLDQAKRMIDAIVVLCSSTFL